MKKVILALFILIVATGFKSISQDIMYKTDGAKEEVKVLEITGNDISFKKFSNLAGPTYTVHRSEVVLIIYENGEHDVITPVTEEKAQQDTILNQDFEPNILAIHLFDVVFGDIGFSYERIINDGMIGIKIPLAFGFYGEEEHNPIYEFDNLFYSGLGINFYPGGQGKARYFVGPQFRFGKGRSWDYYSSEQEYHEDFFYIKYLVDNGVMLTPFKNLSIEIIGTVGIRYISDPPNGMSRVQPTGQFAINLGLRF
jgi:hypothetical protein